MKRIIHLFYIQSNFHLIIASSIIKEKCLSKEDVLFITQRKVNIPTDYSLLFDESGKGLKSRLLFYLKNKKYLNSILADSLVIAYQPFNYLFPGDCYYNEYYFFEEGLSSYSTAIDPKREDRIIAVRLKKLVVNLLFPLGSNSIKGFLIGACNTQVIPKKPTKLYICSRDSYKSFVHKTIQRVLVRMYPLNGDCVISNSNILVLDRMSAYGRPFSVEHYYAALSEFLSKVDLNGKKLYVKLHPADSNDTTINNEITLFFKEKNIEYAFYDGSLDDVALNNKGNTFMGSNSTILFYAPIWGDSNHSYSFVRILAEKDEHYCSFLNRWGGLESFCKLFSRSVDCI